MFGDELKLIIRSTDRGLNTETISSRLEQLQDPQNPLMLKRAVRLRESGKIFLMESSDCEFAEIQLRTQMEALMALHKQSLFRCFGEPESFTHDISNLILAIGTPYLPRGLWKWYREVPIESTEYYLTQSEVMVKFLSRWLTTPCFPRY
jgi:hypothetical protein